MRDFHRRRPRGLVDKVESCCPCRATQPVRVDQGADRLNSRQRLHVLTFQILDWRSSLTALERYGEDLLEFSERHSRDHSIEQQVTVRGASLTVRFFPARARHPQRIRQRSTLPPA